MWTPRKQYNHCFMISRVLAQFISNKSLADMKACQIPVRFNPTSGHVQCN